MDENERIEYVIANLSEEEIRAIALEKLKTINTSDPLLTYASIKAKYIAKKAELGAKFDAKIQRAASIQAERREYQQEIGITNTAYNSDPNFETPSLEDSVRKIY